MSNGAVAVKQLLHTRISRYGIGIITFMALLIAVPLLTAAQTPALTLEITGVDSSAFPTSVITANVYDSMGQPVAGLTAENFALGGSLAASSRIVSVENLATDSLPFATVLIIDVSDSMSGAPLDFAQAAAFSYIESLRPIDPVAILAFGSGVQVIQDYTTDQNALINAIDSLFLNGQTALFQGTYDGILTADGSPVERAYVILLSDGAEFGGVSTVTPEEVIQQAIVDGVPVYTIGLGYGVDRSFLEGISEATNARFAESPSPEELTAIFDDLSATFASQYVITLESDAPADGTNYDLTLSVTQGENTASADAELRAPIPVPIITLPELPVEPIVEPFTLSLDVAADDPLLNISIALNGEPIAQFTQPPYELTIDPLALPAGDYTLTVTATDVDGDSATAEGALTIAALPPVIHVSGLVNGDVLFSDRRIEMTFNSQSPVNHVALLVDGAEVAHLVEAPFEATISINDFGPGDHVVRIAADTAAGENAFEDIPFVISEAPFQTQTANAPTPTPSPTPTFTATPTPNIPASQTVAASTAIPLTATQAAQETQIAAQTGTQSAANREATAGAAIATSNAAATQVSARSTATNAAENTAIAATAAGAAATFNAQQTNQAATRAAQNATSAASTEAALVLAVTTTANVDATLHVEQTQTARIGITATTEANQQTATAQSGQSAATATDSARATSAAEARQAALLATRDALATQNSEARIEAQQTGTARAEDRAQATGTAVARETATEIARATQLAESNATGTALANSLATTTANAVITATRSALETLVVEQQQTLDAGATATADSQATDSANATSTAESLAATATGIAQATNAIRETNTAIARMTRTAIAQETIDTRLAAIGQATQTEEATSEPTPRLTPTAQPTLIPAEAQSAASTDSGGLALLLLIGMFAVIIALVVYAVSRNRRPKQ